MKTQLLSVLALCLVGGFLTAQTLVFHESFEQPLGADSVISASSGSNAWAINTTYAAQGTQSIRCAVQSNDTTTLTTNSFSTLGNQFVILQFKHICKTNFYDYAEIFVSVDNGVNWIKLTAAEYMGTGVFGAISNRFSATSYTDWQGANDLAVPTNAWWKTEEFNISAIAGNKANVKVRFRLMDMIPAGGNGAYGWLIDDLRVTANLDELFPPVITLASPILPDTVFNTGPFQVFADITDASGVDTAMLVFTVNNGTPDTVGMLRLPANRFVGEIPSYTYNTEFCYYIIAIDSSMNQNMGRYPQSGCVYFKNKQPPPVVTIGTNTTAQVSGPTYISSASSSYLYTNHISLFTPTEINSSGKIESLAWDKSNTGGYILNNATMRIYLKHTSTSTVSTVTGTFANELSGATLVYESTTQNIPTTTGWQTFVFNQPNSFIYNGSDNLMVLVYFYRPGNATAAVNWRYTTATGKSQTWSSSTNPPNIAYGANNRPNIQIAFQVTNFAQDAGISQVVEPTGNALVGNTPVRVYLKNYGVDTLTKVNIHYSINGQVRPVYNWTGSILPYLSSGSITIGTEMLAPGSYNIKAWTSMPNDSLDQNFNNDTAWSSGFVCLAILNGTYTVGGAGADFANINDAVSAINLCGMSGPVVFAIQPGIYTSQWAFQNIAAASAVNTITFRSSSFNPDDVVIKYNALGTADNYVVYLNGARNMRFEYLTFMAENSTNGNVILINNGASDNRFTGNKIIGPQVAVNSVNISLVYSAAATTSNDSNNVFRLNTFLNGSYGFYFSGPSTSVLEKGTVIDSNTFVNQYYRAIELRNQEAPVITSNYISSNTEAVHGTTNTYWHGMYLYYCQNEMKILKNHIVAPKGVYGINLATCTSSPGREALIANNFIAEIGGFTFVYGIYLSGCNYHDYYHNSVNITSPTSNAGHAFFLASGTNVRLMNNIFANTGGAFCVRINAPAAIIRSNYNNLFSVATVNWGWWNGTISDFNMWKSASGVDSNSVSMNPVFLSPADLHVSSIPMNNLGTPIAIVPDDFDGELRSISTPDIGADEYTPPAKDISIQSILWPRNSCSLGAQEEVRLIIRNNGIDPVSSFGAAYRINGLPPVFESFTKSIPSLTFDTITFLTKANMSANGLYNMTFYTALPLDENLNNDTIRDYLVFNGHDFYDSDYTTSFEIDDPVRGAWLFSDLNNDNSRWHFFGGANNARTGMIYMGYECNQSNSGNDWFLSRCFTLQANRTYELSFWYKTSDATYAQSVDVKIGNAQTVAAMTTSLISLPNFNNAAYQKATVQFTVPASGEYYLGFYAYSGPVATTTQIMACLDDMTIRLIPPNDAGVVSIAMPQNGCGLGNEQVKVKIKNFGTAIISGGLTASYKLEGTAISVTETVSSLILSGDTLEYTFTTPLNLSAANDTTFKLIAWTTLVGDTLVSSKINDTLTKAVKSFVLPPPPVTSGDTIFSGNTATVSATSSNPISWFADNALTQFLQKGNAYVTAVLYSTTTYYAATAVANPLTVTTGTGTSVQYNIPFYGYYDYGWSAVKMNYSQMGYIDSIGWELGNTISNYAMPNQRIYMALVPDSIFTGLTKPNPAQMTKVFDGTITFNGTGWNTFALQTPFFYDPAFSLLIYYENQKGSTVSGYPSFRYTTTSQYQALYRSQSGSFPNLDGTYTYNRANLRVSIQEGSGCLSTPSPATVVVNLPTSDAGISAILSPQAFAQQASPIDVKLLVKNYGIDTLTNIPVNYKLNNLPVVTQNYTDTLAGGQADTITFSPVSIPAGPFVLIAWTSMPNDGVSINDTLILSGMATIMEPLSFSTGFDTLPVFTTLVSGLTNWEHGTPASGLLNSPHSAPNSWCTNLTTSYNNSANAILSTQLFDFTNAVNAQMAFWLHHNTESGIDGLRLEYTLDNGQNWLSLGIAGDTNATNWFNTSSLAVTSKPGWSGNSGGWKRATYNLNAFSGKAGVRFRFVFESNASGTYDGVCIDDFEILIPPSVDLSLHAITNPAQSSPEGSSQPVQVVVRNSGSAAVSGCTVYYSLNAGTVQNVSYSGVIQPGGLANISLPPVLIPAGFYSLCAWVLTPGDAVGSNDTLCVTRFGKPKYDAAAILILNPLTQHNQGQSVPVRFLVRNLGVDTLSSIPVGYRINSGPVVTAVWTGTLYPNATDTATLPNMTIIAGNQLVCAFTQLPSDFNNLNDTACKMVFGIPVLDIAPIGLVSPSGNNCNTASEQVAFRVRNLGVDTIKFATNPLTLTSSVSGVNPQTFSPAVVNTGQLAPNQTQDIVVAAAYNMSVAGVYLFSATAAMTGDGNPANNSIGPISIGNKTVIDSFPFYETFESGVNSMLLLQPNQYSGLAVSSAAAQSSQYGLHFQGGNPLGWIGEASGANATTYQQAFTTNIAHVANAVSCNINSTGLTNLRLRIDLKQTYSQGAAFSWFRVRINNQTIANLNGDSVFIPATASADPFTTQIFELTPWAGTNFTITLQASCKNPWQFAGGQGDNAFVDNIALFVPASSDAGVSAFIQPAQGSAAAGTTTPVQIRIENYGSTTLTSCQVGFKVGNMSPVFETWTGNLSPNANAIYTFNSQAMVLAGSFTIKAFTNLTGDSDKFNDTATIVFLGIPKIALPYTDDMEGQNFWIGEGSANLWQRGTPTGSTINFAHGGNNAWVTNLSGNYTNNAEEFLYSPFFDFSAVSGASLRFHHWVDAQGGFDGCQVQFSTNNGQTWPLLGYMMSPQGSNWYTHNVNGSHCFSGQSGSYMLSMYDLSALNYVPDPVRFRFRFFSNASVNNFDGWAIDNFSITLPQTPNDAGVTAILNPGVSTPTGTTVPVTVRVYNYGTDSIKTLPVSYMINQQAPVSQTWSLTLGPGKDTSLTFTQTYTGPVNDYLLTAWTSLTGDIYLANDTSLKMVIAAPAPYDIAMRRIIYPVKDGTVVNCDSAKVMVENRGSNPITSFELKYFIGLNLAASRTWTGNLLPGDSLQYTFDMKFNYPMGFWQALFVATTANDGNTANDSMARIILNCFTGLDETDGSGFVLDQNRPNPFASGTDIRFALPAAGEAEFFITDLTGRMILLKQMNLPAGEHSLHITSAQLPAGLYIYGIRYKDMTRIKRMVVMH